MAVSLYVPISGPYFSENNITVGTLYAASIMQDYRRRFLRRKEQMKEKNGRNCKSPVPGN